MKNNPKKFDKALFDEHDSPAKKVVKEYFQREGIILEENKNRYGIDLVNIEDEQIKMGIEVEHRTNWRGDSFPYTTINVPYRKFKFLNSQYKTFFCAVNEEMTAIFVLDMEELKNCEIRENKNKYVKEGELFFSVPLDYGEFIYL